MDPKDVYRFCPRCGSKLAEKSDFLLCPFCKFKLYINPLPCNAAIIENEKHEILLVKRNVEPQKGYWDLPGGFINPGEDLFQSVKREVREELHVEIDITGIVGAYEDTYLFQGVKNHTFIITVAGKILSGTLETDDDVSDYRFFPRESVLSQKISFPGIRKSIKEYLKAAK